MTQNSFLRLLTLRDLEGARSLGAGNQEGRYSSPAAARDCSPPMPMTAIEVLVETRRAPGPSARRESEEGNILPYGTEFRVPVSAQATARLQAHGFYEAEFVKARREKNFLLIFWLVLTEARQQQILPALVLDLCGARHERRKDQTPKSVTFSSAQEHWLKRATE
jgi:hypothetical protein